MIIRNFYAIFLITSYLYSELSSAKLNTIPVQEFEYNNPIEGFLAGTLIKTPSGYEPIEDLNVDNLICGQDEAQSILYLKKTALDSYVEIQINNIWIQTAPHQKFYLYDETLKDACNLKVGDILLDQSCILSVQKIQQNCCAYCLSTEQQNFTIYPNTLVHNFDVVTLGTTGFSLSLGIVEISNPITLVVGGVLLLSWYTTEFFKKVIAPYFEFDYEDPDLTAENLSLHNYETLQATRAYYLTKRQALIDTYQELVKLHSGMMVTLRPNNNSSIFFAQQFLLPIQPKQYQQPMLPDITYEYNLSTVQKQELLSARDAELEKLQQELFDLHLIIAFYINEAFELQNIAKQDLDNILNQIKINYEAWNSNLQSISLSTALEHYGMELLWEHQLDFLTTKTQEIQCILAYAQSLKNHFFIQKTTNLQLLINDRIKTNQSIFGLITKSREKWAADIIITEKKLREHHALSQQLINQIKNQIQTQRTQTEKETLAAIKNKQKAARNIIKNNFKKNSSPQTPNIKGPEKDPDDDWFEQLKKSAKRKALHHKFKKFYKDPQTDLWWSKDNGSAQAGPHYKVFQERATYLEWIKDIDLLGKVMDKHKGPIGKIIPYKELIFY